MTRQVLFQRLDAPGAEACRFQLRDGEVRLRGLIVAALDGVPTAIEYDVQLDEHWVTRRVVVTQRTGDHIQTVAIAVDDGRWSIDGHEQPELTGCTDIDLELSPSTNTLPIKRLGLRIGESERVDAAWLRFPALSLERLVQRYTRMTTNRYRYESGTDFVADLDVDDWGVVRSYPGLWDAAAITLSD